MQIHDIIRSRRIALQLTQEQVALTLGVSTPAVNKWERAVSYPDITLLPALARLLQIDLNTLLSFQEDLSNQEIGLFLNELSAVGDKKGFEEAYKMGMKKIQEYPNCYVLIYHVALILDGLLIIHQKQLEHREMYEAVIIKLFEQMSNVDDFQVSMLAKQMLIRKYLKQESFDKAKSLLDQIPTQRIDKRSLQAEVCMAKKEFEEAAKIEEECLLQGIQEIQSILLKRMDIAIQCKQYDDAMHFADVSKQCAKLFELWEYNQYIAHFELYIKQKKILKIMKIIVPMLRSLTHVWAPNQSILYQHITTKKLDDNFGKSMQKQFLDTLMQDHETAFLREDKAFQAIVEEYK